MGVSFPPGATIQHGSTYMSYSATTRMTTHVNFPVPFASIPDVVATLEWQSGDVSLSYVGCLYMQNISTTGFDIYITNMYGSSFASGNYLHFRWVAVTH